MEGFTTLHVIFAQNCEAFQIFTSLLYHFISIGLYVFKIIIYFTFNQYSRSLSFSNNYFIVVSLLFSQAMLPFDQELWLHNCYCSTVAVAVGILLRVRISHGSIQNNNIIQNNKGTISPPPPYICQPSLMHKICYYILMQYKTVINLW